MVTIAEVVVPAGSFALPETLSRFPEVTVEADRMAAYAPGSTMPCVWADDGDEPGFAASVRNDPTVREVTATAEFEGEHLFHVEWVAEVDQFVADVVDHEGVFLEASARDDQWRLRLRFLTREQFERFRTYFDDHRPQVRLERLFTPKHPRHTRGDVTPEQQEALTAAAELGYFRVPRDASIKVVAAELDISHQAVSERLRRGTENLVQDMLVVEPSRDRT